MSNQSTPSNPPPASGGSSNQFLILSGIVVVVVIIVIVALLGQGNLQVQPTVTASAAITASATPANTTTPTSAATAAATVPATALPISFKYPHNIIPLAVPDKLESQFQSALKQLNADNSASAFDISKATYHFAPDNAKALLELALPIAYAPGQALGTANAKTPDDGQPAQVIGGLYATQIDPSSALVVTYVPASKTIRLYDTNGKQVENPATVLYRRFVGMPFSAPATAPATFAATSPATALPTIVPTVVPTTTVPSITPSVEAPIKRDATNVPSYGDVGAIISAQEICYTVGLDQICLELDLTDAAAQKQAESAIANLTKTYSTISAAQFDQPHAILDLLGDVQHTACTAALAKMDIPIGTLDPTCTPTADWIALNPASAATPAPPSAAPANYQVIGILSILSMDSTANGVALDTHNNPAGEVYDAKTLKNVAALPSGDYLLLAPSIDPTTGAPVQTGATEQIWLMDVNNNAFIIPGLKVEAFGATDSKTAPSALQSFDKDSGAGGYWQP